MDEQMPISPEHGKPLAFWFFPSFDQHDRSRAWYIMAIFLAIAFLVYSYFDKNYLFPIIIVIIAAILFQRERRQAEIIGFGIYNDGIELSGEGFHPYSQIKNFWIAYQPPAVRFLYFRVSAGIHGILRIPLEDENPVEIREILAQFLPEDLERETEPALDALGRRLKL